MHLRGPIQKQLFTLAAITLAAAAFAQTAPTYNAATEVKVKGTVEEVKLDTTAGGKPVAYLILKNGEEKTQVFICPKAFLDDMGVKFAPGDEVQVTGSKVKRDGADVILAREVVKSGDTLTVRFNDGKPAW